MTTATFEITLAMSRQDGAQAAARLFANGILRPEMLTAAGVKPYRGQKKLDWPWDIDWERKGINLDNAAEACWANPEGESESRYWRKAISSPDVPGDLEGEHWDAFLSGFYTVAEAVFA